MDTQSRFQKIEDLILENFKSTTPLIILGLLLLYIVNVNNHYQLFIDEDEKLRNKIESLQKDNNISHRLNYKITRHSQMIGHKMPIFEKNITGSGYKFAAIYTAESNAATNNRIVRIVRDFQGENSDIQVVTFSNKERGNSKDILVKSDNITLKGIPNVYLLGSQNEILSAIALDGSESQEVLQLVANYLSGIVRPRVALKDQEANHDHEH